MICHIAGPMKSWTLYGSKKRRRKAFDSVILCGGTRKMKAAVVLYICSKRSYWAKP
jgi:hypothetical protein